MKPEFTHREVLAILAGVLLGMFLAALDQTVVATALPTLAADLGGADHLSWIVAGYLLAATASAPIYGKLSDIYGRRAMLRVAIAVFVVGSVLSGLSQSILQLVGARALQGLGGGGLMTLAHATIGDVVSPRERGRYQAYISGMWAVASVGGPTVGGLFVDFLSWRWIFVANVPLGLAALFLCHRALRRLAFERVARPIDYLGALLLTGAVGPLLLVITWGGTVLPWNSAMLHTLAAAGAALLVLFVLQERRAPEPMLPPRLLRNPVVRVANLASFLNAMAVFGASIFLPVFFQLVTGASASASGLLIIPLMGGTVCGAFTSGQLMRWSGRSKPFPLGGLVLVSGSFLVLATVTPESPPLLGTAAMAIAGYGFGLVFPVMLVSVQNAAEPRDLGAASATVNFFRSLGGSFGVAVLWSVLLLSLDAGDAALAREIVRGGPAALAGLPPDDRILVAAQLTEGFHAVFLAIAAIAALGFVVLLFLEERPLGTVPVSRKQPAGD